MNDGIRLGLVLGLLVTSLAHADGKPRTSSRGPRLEAVTFVIHHRVFHEFRDMQRVKLNQDFTLGDTEFSARVVQYVPDFQMDLEHHRIFTLSDQPNNPAFKVIVRKGKAPQDTSWGFLKSPPHFGARSFFAFRVVRIDFAGRPPLLADTTAARWPAGVRPPAPGARDPVRKP